MRRAYKLRMDAIDRIAKSLENWCHSHHVEKVTSLTGALDVPK
jgi:dihydroorotate dehydrogenase (NAD+) catalytic subunit